MTTPSYLLPLFWHHGETPEVIVEEIAQMHANGIGGFIVESRPHPDFLGDSWWRDLAFILAEARRRDMKVWVFDDSKFPTGFAGGRIRDRYPQFLKCYLRQQHVDVIGPKRDALFHAPIDRDAGEKLIRVVAARHSGDAIDPATLVDLTATARWDVPAGTWRIFFFIQTRSGGEDATKDYLNLLDPQAVRAFIEIVHEAHYARFADDFGKTFAGFFNDEPRFGNHPSYFARLGEPGNVLPYSDTLLDELSSAWGRDFSLLLPCLWHNIPGDIAAQARYTFMDVVSRLYATNFAQQIGDWCRAHGVQSIGHVIEDSGAHARLGYGVGHFFRALRGQDVSGFDIVLHQLLPEHTEGLRHTPFGDWDDEFFHWGLAKLASSEGHIDPKKQGRTACEIFGAYGWSEGLKLMKWMTDHVCVRGTNLLIPHAFSPKECPDPDCPPHFFARGQNPQWRYFHLWSAYANRVCELLSGGTHVAPVAVVYHAEAEWAGEYEPFEKAVKTLAQHQIDCDVVPIDTLMDAAALRTDSQGLGIHRETYRALIVPYAQRLPAAFARRLMELARGVPIIFTRDWPEALLGDPSVAHDTLRRLKSCPNVAVADHAQLPEQSPRDVQAGSFAPDLRCYHYRHADREIYFLANDSTRRSIDTTLSFAHAGFCVAFDALENTYHEVELQTVGQRAAVRVLLEPYESRFLIFTPTDQSSIVGAQPRLRRLVPFAEIDGPWRVSTATAQTYPHFSPEPRITGLGDASAPHLLPKFSGTLRYETEFEFQNAAKPERLFLDLGRVNEIAEVKVNGRPAGTRICPPYHVEISNLASVGRNSLQIDVTNTLAGQFGDNVFDRAIAQEPSGLIGPVRLLVDGE